MAFIPTSRTIQIAGRVFTQDEITAFESGTTGVILYAATSTAGDFMTLRTANGTAGFQVPAGKTLTMKAVRIFSTTNTQATGVVLMSSTAEVTTETSTAPAGVVYLAGVSTGGTQNKTPAGSTEAGIAEAYVNFTVAQNLWPGVRSAGANDTFQVFCTIA